MKAPLLFATCLSFVLALAGCDRQGESKSTLGAHTLTIVDSSGKPYGGTTWIKVDDAAETTTYSFDSANGRYKITLEGEVLTINDARYTLDKPSSEIRIVDDNVEIDGVKASPDEES